jgi:hypothetical protein
MTRVRFSINLQELEKASWTEPTPDGEIRVVGWERVKEFIGKSMVDGFDTIVFMDEPTCGLCDQKVPVEGNRHVLFRDPSYKSRKVFMPCTATARSKS